MTIDKSSLQSYSSAVREHEDKFTKNTIPLDAFLKSDTSWNIKANEKRLQRDNNIETEGVFLQFLGTNSLFLTDEKTNILIDPYFSRKNFKIASLRDKPDLPPIKATKTKKSGWGLQFDIGRNGIKPSNIIASGNEDFLDHLLDNLPIIFDSKARDNVYEPDTMIIKNCLKKASIKNIDALFVSHAHFDHAFDIAEVLRYFKEINGEYPKTIGCESVANIIFGGLLKDDEYKSAPCGETGTPVMDLDKKCSDFNIDIPEHLNKYKYTVGDFTVTLIRGNHIRIPFSPRPDFIGGKILTPIKPPASFAAYNEGILYNFIIEHKKFDKKIIIMGSANFFDDDMQNKFASQNENVDIMIIGVAGLSILRGAFTGGPGTININGIKDYFNEVIHPCKPETILFSHWDEFKHSLDKPAEWVTNIKIIAPSPPKVYDDFKKFVEDKEDMKNEEINMSFLPMWDMIPLL